MRAPRVRFTGRGLMVAVAVVGLAAGAEVMRRRGADFRRRASSYSELAADLHEVAASEAQSALSGVYVSRTADGAIIPATRDLLTGRAGHYAALARKYERAARYPWLHVEPDPPEPPPAVMDADAGWKIMERMRAGRWPE